MPFGGETRHCPQRQVAAVGKSPCTTIQPRAHAQGNASGDSPGGWVLTFLFSQVLSRTHPCSRRRTFSGAPHPQPPPHSPQAGSGLELQGLGTSGLAGEGWATQPSRHPRTHMSSDRLGRQRGTARSLRAVGKARGEAGGWGGLHRDGYRDVKRALCGSLPGLLTPEPPYWDPAPASQSV